MQESEKEELAGRQYAAGLINRRIAVDVARLDAVFEDVTGERGSATFLCACGREDCGNAVVTVPLAEFELVRTSPHRFLVAPGHATEIDEVVHRGDGYEIVEIRPEYRSGEPPTGAT